MHAAAMARLSAHSGILTAWKTVFRMESIWLSLGKRGERIQGRTPGRVPLYVSFFFFQAEDGIRAKLVTGVQTCALPIFGSEERQRHVALAGVRQHDRDHLDRKSVV